MARPNDGDLDILVNNNGGPPQLLRNDWHVPANRGEFSFTCLPNANHWLQILLIGTRSNRDGVGSRVKVYAGDLKLYDQKKGGMETANDRAGHPWREFAPQVFRSSI
jgi:hypothetical protein